LRAAAAQLLVPLHENVAQVVSRPEQLTAVPRWHTPAPSQVSAHVHGSPSSQVAPVRIVSRQPPAPSQVRLTHGVDVHVVVRPAWQTPDALQTSFEVHALPSLHVSPVRAVTVHDAVPLQVEVEQDVLVQVTSVPMHVPDVQVSEWVHSLPSSHAPPGRQAQVPPTFVHWYAVPPHVTSWHIRLTVASHR
jgi:hypothetical protein